MRARSASPCRKYKISHHRSAASNIVLSSLFSTCDCVMSFLDRVVNAFDEVAIHDTGSAIGAMHVATAMEDPENRAAVTNVVGEPAVLPGVLLNEAELSDVAVAQARATELADVELLVFSAKARENDCVRLLRVAYGPVHSYSYILELHGSSCFSFFLEQRQLLLLVGLTNAMRDIGTGNAWIAPGADRDHAAAAAKAVRTMSSASSVGSSTFLFSPSRASAARPA